MATSQAVVNWKEGMLFEGTGMGHTIKMGALVPGGEPEGIGPMTLLLVALGGCTAMDIVHILGKERQELCALSVEVTGEKAADYPTVYTNIEVVYKVQGHNLSPEAVKRAVELSEEKYCCVGVMLGQAAKITNRIEIEQV